MFFYSQGHIQHQPNEPRGPYMALGVIAGVREQWVLCQGAKCLCGTPWHLVLHEVGISQGEI